MGAISFIRVFLLEEDKCPSYGGKCPSLILYDLSVFSEELRA